METGAPTREGEDRRQGELHAVCLPGADHGSCRERSIQPRGSPGTPTLLRQNQGCARRSQAQAGVQPCRDRTGVLQARPTSRREESGLGCLPSVTASGVQVHPRRWGPIKARCGSSTKHGDYFD